MGRYAIISVYDKTGIEPFAQFLKAQGVQILSTGGTAQHLRDKGFEVISISDYTGYPEILDGRVKSLHPKIHGGILARLDKEKDKQELASIDAGSIEYVVVNLYPFTQRVAEISAKKEVNHGSLVELIDIGGPTMIRAAAKNNQFVVPISDPADFEIVIREASEKGSVTPKTRQYLAGKVFTMMAEYDGAIARYFSLGEELLEKSGEPKALAPVEPILLRRVAELRYGENPHQHASLYSPEKPKSGAKDGENISTSTWAQLQGKELSYNNLLDMNGALELFLDLADGFKDQHVAVIIKHSNPCGAAVRATPLDAFLAARACDPVSAFGGIIAITGEVDSKLATTITEGFVELVLAKSFDAGARKIFEGKKNIRLLQCDMEKLNALRATGHRVVRDCGSDYLLQSSDSTVRTMEPELVKVGNATPAMLKDMDFAWRVCKHVKSNAIVVVKDLQAIGVGAGQMSRVDSAKLSLARAKEHGFSPEGAVAASDAFLPFSDTLEILNDGGVTALVQPGGSVKDDEVIACAKKRGVTMLFTGERHFRH